MPNPVLTPKFGLLRFNIPRRVICQSESIQEPAPVQLELAIVSFVFLSSSLLCVFFSHHRIREGLRILI